MLLPDNNTAGAERWLGMIGIGATYRYTPTDDPNLNAEQDKC